MSRYNFNREDATFLSDLLQEIDDRQEMKFKENKDYFFNKNDKVDLIDRINKSKTETIMWIVGIGVLQFILTILSKNFL